MVAVLLLVGCDSNDDKGVVLNTKYVTLYSEGTEKITANEDVSWTSESNFIAKVSEDGVVTGNHVGKTMITATSGKSIAQCEVEVKAKYNRFMEPILEFGLSRSEVRSREKRSLTQDDAEGLGYNGENSAIRGVAYLFDNNGKLEAALLGVSNLYAIEAMDFLLERYQPIGEKDGTFLFINNDMDKYNMGIGLTAKSGYVMIMYLPKPLSARSFVDDAIMQKLESMLENEIKQ